MTDLFPVSLDEQIAEAERELALRRRVFPGWIATGKLTQDKADRRIAAMNAIAESLHRLKGLEK